LLKKAGRQEPQQRLKDLYVSVGLFKQFILDKYFLFFLLFSSLIAAGKYKKTE
jgi:hypothetical protein